MQNYSPLNLLTHVPLQNFNYSIIHDTAQEYRELYEHTRNKNDFPIKNNWRPIYSEKNKNNNFKATAYQHSSGKIVICYEGTDFLSRKDWGANLKMAIGKESSQMKSALSFYDKVAYNNPGVVIDLAGHSEGGSEATYVALARGRRAYTFNAYGLSDEIVNSARKENGGEYGENKIFNYRDKHDPVSKSRKLIGETFIVPSVTDNWILTKTPLGSFWSHLINNMGNIRNAIPLNVYKLQDLTFLDTVNEMHITDQNIIDMPTDIFSLFESEIDERLRNYQITDEQTAQQMALRGELVYVRGYQRRDDTIVKGYYRRAA